MPSDEQIIGMHRQTERWSKFRRNLHGEAMLRRQERNTVFGGIRPEYTSTSRVDATGNLLFLGVSPTSVLGKQLLPPPQPCGSAGTALTQKDEEHFSQVDSRFLRRFGQLESQANRRRQVEADLRVSHTSSAPASSPVSSHDRRRAHPMTDPMAFKFEQQWARLRKDSIFDLDQAPPADDDEHSSASAGRASPEASGAVSAGLGSAVGRGGSAPLAGTRHGSLSARQVSSRSEQQRTRGGITGQHPCPPSRGAASPHGASASAASSAAHPQTARSLTTRTPRESHAYSEHRTSLGISSLTPRAKTPLRQLQKHPQLQRGADLTDRAAGQSPDLPLSSMYDGRKGGVRETVGTARRGVKVAFVSAE